MDIKIVQKFDDNYYEECYSEWLKFRSTYKKWENKIGIISILIGVIVFFVSKELRFISIGMFIFGTLMIYEYSSLKRKWIKARLDSRMNNKSATMIFRDNEIQSYGPYIEMSGKWDFFKDAIETEKGLFLIPENGISIYQEFICSKIRCKRNCQKNKRKSLLKKIR